MKLAFIALVALMLGQLYLAYKAAFGRDFDIPTYLKGMPSDVLARARPILAIQHLLFGIAFSLFIVIFFLRLPAAEIKGLGAVIAAAVAVIALACRGIIYLKVRKSRRAN